MSGSSPGLLLFHRRLAVLASIVIFGFAGLTLQLWRLAISQGPNRKARAESRLERTEYLPTWRSRIVDRQGRILAGDEPTFDLAVQWDLITGDRASSMARDDARSSVGAERWGAMSPEARSQLMTSFVPARELELESFWSMIAEEGGIERLDLDRRLDSIRKSVQQTAAVVWARQEEAYHRQFGIDAEFSPQPIREHRDAHVVLARLGEGAAMRLRILSEGLDGTMQVRHARRREYPMQKQAVLIDCSTLPSPIRRRDVVEIEVDDVAAVLLGGVRKHAWAEDVEARPFQTADGGVDLGGYQIGDEIGAGGLEEALETTLRGQRGRVVRDRQGTELKRTPPAGGEDVRVTIDTELQARVEAILSGELGLMTVQQWHRNEGLPTGTPLRGGVVVLDVASSEILAMASTPTMHDDVDADALPWLNRASEGLYPPGSILKPLLLAAAVTDGVVSLEEPIECTGHFFEGVKGSARCWMYREKYGFATHGPLHAIEAVARSCNIFFYEVGSRMGMDRMLQWLEDFGLGKPLARRMTHPGSESRQGHVPDAGERSRVSQRGALPFATISMAIGQGSITWSPLHAAAAYAALARGGTWLDPVIIRSDRTPVQMHLDAAGVELAMNGLRDAVNAEYGTGTNIILGPGRKEPIFNVAGVRTWGKTGTAEAPPLVLDGKRIDGLDHSWFVVMAAPTHMSRPTVVVVVLVEYGGSGGRVAGPLSNQVLHALRATGYLR